MKIKPESSPQTVTQEEKTEVFKALFAIEPELSRLNPVTFKRQSTSRKVIRNGDRNHHVGLFASRLNHAQIPFESTLEKQACTIFESYPEIQAYQAQPYSVHLYYHGNFRTVYPDFEITTTKKKVLVDIKHEKHTRNPLFRERCSALAYYAEQRGMAYTLMTEKTIRGQRLLNSQWLLSLAIGQAKPGLRKVVLNWISSLNESTFGDLFDLTPPYPQVRCVLADLALDGHLDLQLELPVREQQVSHDSRTEV